MTQEEKQSLKNELLAHRNHFELGWWELWSACFTDYGPVEGSKKKEIVRGVYVDVVDYALDEPWFAGFNDYGVLCVGSILYINVPIIQISPKASIPREMDLFT